MKNYILVAALLLSGSVYAQETSQWKHESEASAVTTSGNTKTQTYSVKQTTSYQFDKNILENKANYLLQKDSGDKKAENWLVSLKYERELSERLNVFVAQTADSDKFASIYRRYSSDAGAKYFLIKNENRTLFTELGYRYSYEDYLSPQENDEVHFARLYLEGNRKWNSSLSHKIWIEYLPNFTNSDDYRLNFEPSLSVLMTEVFSLKLAYLVKYRGEPPVGTEKRDTIYTTAIVAKF